MKKIFIISILFVSFLGHSQDVGLLNNESCEQQTYAARMFLTGNEVIEQDISKGMSLLTQLADLGCAKAQLRLGLVYKKDTFTTINEAKAFEYIQKAADKGLPRAIAELGVLHQLGIGCSINYETAFSLYEKSYELGDGMGAYCIGYNFFKGLGSIEQSYIQAVRWFAKSDYPMAKHWLAICNYFGYGMPVNKNTAYQLLSSNSGIVNSRTLLAHLKASKDEAQGVLADYQGMDVEQETAQINKLFESQDSTSIELTEEAIVLIAEQLTGSWTGKLVELDWSGERILRNFSASFQFSKDTAGIAYKANINKNKTSNIGVLLDESIYFQDFEISLPRLYKDNPKLNELNYSVLNADFQIKTIDNVRFLVGYVDTKVNNWGEPGPPMLLVLVDNNVISESEVEISEELLGALLAEQGENFIALYPNPFKTHLLIQFDLVKDSSTTVEIYSLDGMFNQVIANKVEKKAGKQLFQYNGSNLQSGLYVVRVTVEGVVHTKLIIKK